MLETYKLPESFLKGKVFHCIFPGQPKFIQLGFMQFRENFAAWRTSACTRKATWKRFHFHLITSSNNENNFLTLPYSAKHAMTQFELFSYLVLPPLRRLETCKSELRSIGGFNVQFIIRLDLPPFHSTIFRPMNLSKWAFYCGVKGLVGCFVMIYSSGCK